MYNKFYGFIEKPFEITPDPKFLYLSENHREALAHLTYAVRERKGFTVITGEVGTGKTILIQTLLSKLNGTVRTAYLFNPRLDSNEFLQYVCEDLGVKGEKKLKGACLAQLHHFLMDCYARNENVVLIVDEAQNLDLSLLEEIRLLTNLETPKSKLLHVILMGQPELDRILNRPECRQLKQRVSLRHRIQPLNREETREYIQRRLKIAGAIRPNYFSPDAMRAIYRYSKGIPRLINILCDNALLLGYATDQKVIGKSMIREVIRDLEPFSLERKKKYLWVAILLASALIFLGAIIFWWGDDLARSFEGLLNGVSPKYRRFFERFLHGVYRLTSWV
ncbi:MAG: ExeA family protein [Thermodesulfobacteriota bacterium]